MDDASIKRIWDGFGPEGQNMPFLEFHRQMVELTDPAKITQDVMDIQLRKARERTNRIRIDKRLGENHES